MQEETAANLQHHRQPANSGVLQKFSVTLSLSDMETLGSLAQLSEKSSIYRLSIIQYCHCRSSLPLIASTGMRFSDGGVRLACNSECCPLSTASIAQLKMGTRK